MAIINRTEPKPKTAEAALKEHEAVDLQVEVATSKGEMTVMEPTGQAPGGVKLSLLKAMADRYHMEPTPFQAAVMAVCFRPDKDGRVVTMAEFSAFMLVAHDYRLNPVTREIYGFKAKNGAIVPVVGIDGWCRIINERRELDGIEFDDILVNDQMTAITCRIWRCDRKKPTEVTEYMVECQRSTEPWQKWPRRMLRHKALIQCARYAFGFAGIYELDEAERITGNDALGIDPPKNDVRDAGPPVFTTDKPKEAAKDPQPQTLETALAKVMVQDANQLMTDRAKRLRADAAGEKVYDSDGQPIRGNDAGPVPGFLDRTKKAEPTGPAFLGVETTGRAAPPPANHATKFLDWFKDELANCTTGDQCNDAYTLYIDPARESGEITPIDEHDIVDAFDKRMAEIKLAAQQ
jgi:phage recombination protein Bet